MNILVFLFISIHRAQRPRSGRPSKCTCISEVFVGKASTISIEITPIPPLTFTGVKKCAIWRRFQRHLIWAARVWKYSKITERWNIFRVSSSSLMNLCPRTLENRLSLVPTPKIARRKRAKSSITQPWIIRFRSNFARSYTQDTRSTTKLRYQEVI